MPRRSRLMRCVVRCGLAVAVGVLIGASSLRADVTSDQAAAILIFPKLVVDTSSVPVTPRGRVDTLIRLSNTSNTPISMRCFYVDATPQCSNGSGSCLSSPVACTGACTPQWQETDFVVNLTARQPIAWVVSQGAIGCAEDNSSGLPCFPLSANGRPGPNGQNNDGSRIPPAPEDPFVGELTCFAVDLNEVPVSRNDLKGEVEITRSNPDGIDVEGYNAIGIPALPGLAGTIVGDVTQLVLGGSLCDSGQNAQSQCATAKDCPGGKCINVGQYSGCPGILILDHFFDGADDPASGMPVTTDLTLVPCSEDFVTTEMTTTPVQFLVFNEFEQRFSTSRRVTCFQEFRLSNIDTPNPNKSIFSAAVNGTLTGQTLIRGVGDQDPAHGHGILGVAEEFRQGGGTAAFNLHFGRSRLQSDFIYAP